VETPIVSRRTVWSAAGLLAVAFLAFMAFSGQLRESKQFVKFVPAGVLTEVPADIDRVEIATGAARWAFVRRSGSGWQSVADGRPVAASLAGHLDDSLKFMHASAPIRVMERAEWLPLGLREFGLDPPGYRATLYRGDTAVLEAEFGAPNPQKVLQYMKLGGRDQLYLMSRSVGQQWEETLREVSRR